MNFIGICARHRVLAYMLSGAIILFGAIGVRDIGIDRLPNISPPGLVITTLYPGASPAVVDSSVSGVIESAINTVSGIETIQSTSRPGASEIFVKFFTSKDPDVAFNETQSKLNQVLNELPREAERPVLVKIDPNATPVVRLFLTGDRPLSELNQLARDKVKKSLESISGVGEVSVGGDQERKIRVDLDLSKLSSLGLSVQDVMEAFSREHIQIPGGYLVGGMLEKLLHLDLEYHSIRELGELVVISREQVPVKLKHIARLTDGLEDPRSLARFNGQPGVVIVVRKVKAANTVAIVRQVRREVDHAVRPQLPDGVRLLIATNEADIISETVSALRSHIVEGTLLAGVVVLLFLLNIPSTLIIGTAVPVSLAGAVMVMYFGGYTVNVLTLSALLLLIGVVVDDAIVVLENINRQHEAGPVDPETAAVRGTREVLLAVVAASLTLVCMFGTVIFAEGMLAIFLRSFAIVVTVGVVTSLFVSVTLIPALCARFLTESAPPRYAILRWIETGHQWLERLYLVSLEASLRHRGTVIVFSLLIVASSAWFMTRLGGEFFPEDDESRILVTLEAPLGSSITYMGQKLEEAETLLRRYPEVEHILSTVGSGRNADVNEATLNVQLFSKAERQATQAEIVARSRRDLATIPGIKSFVGQVPFVNGMGSEPFEAFVTGPNLDGVAVYAQGMFERLQQHGGMGELRLELDLARPQLSFEIDRARARALGISAQQIGDTIRVLAGGADIAKYNSLPGDGERYDVRLSALREGMREARDLENVYLKGPEGKLVRLGAVVRVRETMGPALIERTDLQYSAGFYANPDVTLEEAVRIFRSIGEEMLPPGYGVTFSGQADEMAKSTEALKLIFASGLLLVYMVLASQFNSFLQPAIIMLAQPLAIVGGVFALWLFDYSLNIFSMIGLVLLVGLVSKNSILLVDLINQYCNTGVDTQTAITTACPRRMRPVLMTSMTIVLAMLPAAVGVGAGAGQYGPLAVAVIGGVVSSTLLTLVVVPVAYSLLDQWLPATDVEPDQPQDLPAGATSAQR